MPYAVIRDTNQHFIAGDWWNFKTNADFGKVWEREGHAKMFADKYNDAVARKLEYSPESKLHQWAVEAGTAEAVEVRLIRPDNWIQGMPSVTQVHKHQVLYPIHDPNNCGGNEISVSAGNGPEHWTVSSAEEQNACNWLCIDPKKWAAYPTIIRLRVVKNTILLANGFSFWQPLEQCEWASRSKYRPLACDGTTL